MHSKLLDLACNASNRIWNSNNLNDENIVKLWINDDEYGHWLYGNLSFDIVRALYGCITSCTFAFSCCLYCEEKMKCAQQLFELWNTTSSRSRYSCPHTLAILVEKL